MYDFKRTNKITGVHWLTDPVENVKIKVKLKPHDGIMSLPKFEDYTNNANSVNLETFEKTEEHTFSWQEKVFSLWELKRYSDVHSCTTDTELSYYNKLKDSDSEPSKIFTYIQEDYQYPLPFGNTAKKNNILDISDCLGNLNLKEKIENVLTSDSSSMGHLFRSEENLDVTEESWTAMHIVFDNSEYNGDTQLVFKQEAILISLYYNTVNNCLLVCPDCNDLEMNPYCVETATGVPLGYEYSVEVIFEHEEENCEELLILLKKLSKKWEKKHKQLVNFSMPPLGKKIYQVTLEIVSAMDFEMDDIYVEFNIKLPEGIQCSNPLNGQTSVTNSLKLDDSEVWNFGHTVELSMEMDMTTDPSPLQVFIEVISTDWWGRHRTEGYGYLPLALEPGINKKILSCSRPEEMNRVEAESRRFFVGGCHLIKDLKVLVEPQLQEANFIYRSTGNVLLQWHVITQSPIPGYSKTEETVHPSTSASALLQGAEAVLRQYRRARAKLAAATKDLEEKGDESDG